MKVYSHNIFDWASCALESCVAHDYSGPVIELKSSSRQATSTSSSVENTSRNLNLQDTEGVTVGEAGGDVTIVQTDMNAFDNAAKLASKSLDVSSDAMSDSFALVKTISLDAGANILESQDNAFKFGERSFGLVEKAYQDTGEYIEGAFEKVLGFVGTVQGKAQESLSGTVKALNDSFRENTKSSDERVTDIAKNLMYVLGAVALGTGAFFMFRKRG